MMAARRVAEVLLEERDHRLDDAGIDPRRGVPVHVDGQRLDAATLEAGLVAERGEVAIGTSGGSSAASSFKL